MPLKVRRAAPQELGQLIDLQNHAIATLCSSHYSEPQIKAIITTQARVRSCNEQLYVAEQDGHIVGFAALLGFDWAFWARSGQIGGVYVHPDYARQGVATQLMQTLEQIAIAKHYRELVVTSSLNAVPFYQAQGYEQTGAFDIPGDHRVSIPCVFLRKQYQQPQIPAKTSVPGYLQWALFILLLPLVLVAL